MKDGLETRQAVIDTCRWLLTQGYVFGTWGNISVRLDSGNILITPTRVGYAEMTPDDLVVLAPDGTRLQGFRLATSERELHRGILNLRPDVQAVIHTHSPFAMAAAALNSEIPPLSEEMCQIIGGSIPITPHFVASEKHTELGEVASAALGGKNALLIRNHGPICCGRTLEEAKVCCQITEKAAQIYIHIAQNPSISPVQEPWVTAGRNYYLHAYGKT